MAQPNVEVCSDWTTPTAVGLRPGCDAEAAGIADKIATASWLLFHYSGRQYPGVCTDRVRPCRRTEPARATFQQYGWGTWSWESSWGICGCGGHPERGTCGCSGLSEITLGASPVVDVLEVRVDGELLPESAYRVDDHRWLVRIDGDSWPCCQDLTADPATDDNTFEVLFTYGVDPPQAGKDAAAALACELLKAGTGGDCSLPKRLQTLSVQGATMAILDPFEFLENGRLGVYEVDIFLGAANPQGITRSAQVLNPDIGRPVRRTSDPGGS